MDDDALYRQYLSGDASAGDALMLHLGDALTAYLSAFLHDPQDAEDLMLDCFTVILVNRPAIAEGCFRAYLYRMARNKATRMWRLRLKRRAFSLDETLPSGEASPEDAIRDKERDRGLHRCLNRIAPQYREALWLVYGTGLTYAQTAAVLGCSLKRVDNLLTNGKRQLRAALEMEGITHADI